MAPRIKGISFIKRSQYICLDFKTYQGQKPVYSDYINFIFDDLHLKDDEIGGVGEHSHTNMYMFHVIDAAKYKEILSLVEKGVPWTTKGGAMIYGHSCDEYITTVRITNYDPFSMNLDDILANISQYGKILNYHNPCIPNHPTVSSNSIIIKMKIEEGRELPSVLYNAMHQEVLKLHFPGAERICHNCNQQGHTISWCKQKSVLADYDSGGNTWAAIAAGNPKPNPRTRKVTPAAKPRINNPEDFPSLSGSKDKDYTEVKKKSAAPKQNVQHIQIPTKNTFDILEGMNVDDSGDIIPPTQPDKADQNREKKTRKREKKGSPEANPTGGEATVEGDLEDSLGHFSPSLPCNQAALRAPIPEDRDNSQNDSLPCNQAALATSTSGDSQISQIESLHLEYQGSIRSQSLLDIPDSLRIDQFNPSSLKAGSSFPEHQSMEADDTDDPGEPDNPGNPEDLNPGETHLKRGLIRSTGLDSPQKKKLFVT